MFTLVRPIPATATLLLALACGGKADPGALQAEECCTCVAGQWSPTADCTLPRGLAETYGRCAAGSGHEGAFDETSHHLRSPGALAGLDPERRERTLRRCTALAAEGDHPVVDSTRGLLLLEGDRPEAALEALEARATGTWLSDHPAIAQDHLQALARAQRAAGSPDDAARTLARAERLTDGPTPKSHGWSLEREGRVHEALAHWEAMHSDTPDDVDVLLGLVRMLGATGRPQDAEPALQRLLTVAPDHPDVLMQAGIARYQQGRDDQAEGHFLQAIAQGGQGNSCPFEGLGLVYLRQGRTDEARAQLETAIELAPDDEYKKYDAMARILMDDGDHEGAAQMLQKSRENNPEGAAAGELEAELAGLRAAVDEGG